MKSLGRKIERKIKTLLKILDKVFSNNADVIFSSPFWTSLNFSSPGSEMILATGSAETMTTDKMTNTTNSPMQISNKISSIGSILS